MSALTIFQIEAASINGYLGAGGSDSNSYLAMYWQATVPFRFSPVLQNNWSHAKSVQCHTSFFGLQTSYTHPLRPEERHYHIEG